QKDFIQAEKLLEFGLQSTIDTLIDSGEYLHTLLNRGHRRGSRGVLSGHLTDEDFSDRGQLFPRGNQGPHKLKQHRGRLFRRNRYNLLTEVIPRAVDCTPSPRLEAGFTHT